MPVVFLAAAWDVLLVLLQVLLPHLLPLPHHRTRRLPNHLHILRIRRYIL